MGTSAIARLGFATVAAIVVALVGGAVPRAGADLPVLEPAPADLSLTLSVDDPTPVVGQEVTFTIALTNAGPNAVPVNQEGPFTFVEFHNRVPAGSGESLEYVPGSHSVSQGTTSITLQHLNRAGKVAGSSP